MALNCSPVLHQSCSVEGNDLNHLVGPLGDDTYKISRLLALWIQTRFFFFTFSLYKPM